MDEKLKRIRLMEMFLSQRLQNLLCGSVLILLPIYFLLKDRWPLYEAKSYFVATCYRMADLRRGELPFFIERQRRSVFELSRSVYMQNLITYMKGQSEITEQQILKMQSFIKVFQGYFGYKQILLLDRNGVFVFSTLPGLNGKKITDDAYKHSSIVDSYTLVSKTFTSDISNFQYDPVVGQKAIFITMPVFFNNALNGFLVVQLDNHALEKLVAQNIQLGKTGEYLITQQIGNKINFILAPKDQEDLVLPVLPTINRDTGSPSERSALGYEGYGVTADFRGNKVVAAWYSLPQLNWGFVSKTDYAEIIFPIRLLGYAILLIIVCAIIALLFNLKRRISKPIEQTALHDEISN